MKNIKDSDIKMPFSKSEVAILANRMGIDFKKEKFTLDDLVEGMDVEPGHEIPQMRPCPTCGVMVLSTTKERHCPACLRALGSVHDAQPDYEYVGNVYPGGTYR